MRFGILWRVIDVMSDSESFDNNSLNLSIERLWDISSLTWKAFECTSDLINTLIMAFSLADLQKNVYKKQI